MRRVENGSPVSFGQQAPDTGSNPTQTALYTVVLLCRVYG